MAVTRRSSNSRYALAIRCVPADRTGMTYAARYKAIGCEPVGCAELAVNGRLDFALQAERRAGNNGIGLAQLAYNKLFDVRRSDPRFITIDRFSFSICAAIAAMSGLVAPASRLEDLSKLADQYDADPFMVPPLDHPPPQSPAIGTIPPEYSWATLVFCRRECEGMPAQQAYHTGVGRLHTLTQNSTPHIWDRIQEELDREQARVKKAREVLNTMKMLKGGVAVVEAPLKLWGFDIWHNEGPNNQTPGGAPCVVVFRSHLNIGLQYAEISVRSVLQAQKMFGPDGLLEVLPRLRPGRWSGNMMHAGSPYSVTEKETRQAAELLSKEALNRTSAIPVIRC